MSEHLSKLEEQLRRARIQLSEEKAYLSSLSIDTTTIFQVVKKSIDEWDPFRLLAMECPPDEYDSEIRRITIYITKRLDDLDVMELEAHIRFKFEESFGEEVVQDQRSMDVAFAITASLKECKLIS